MVDTTPDLTVVIPARNEAGCVGQTVDRLRHATARYGIYTQLVVVDDHSTDDTGAIASNFGATVITRDDGHPGYGRTVRRGLEAATGRWVTVMVADGSDDVEDLIAMCCASVESDFCGAVFGDRWDIKGASVVGYPRLKRVANRIGNTVIGLSLGSTYADWTNPFKLYRFDVLHKVLPQCKAEDFSLGMELAIKAWPLTTIKFVPHHWKDRETGKSKFKVKHVIGFLRTLYRTLPYKTKDSVWSCFGLFLLFVGVVIAFEMSK